MTPAAKRLLEKLLRTRPKPDEQALTELFMAIKSTPLQDLIGMVRQRAPADANVTEAVRTPAELEAEIKRQLRKVGGKAADFLPYLLDAIMERAPRGTRPPAVKGLTLAKGLTFAAEMSELNLSSCVESAMATFVSENDVSYRLRSA